MTVIVLKGIEFILKVTDSFCLELLLLLIPLVTERLDATVLVSLASFGSFDFNGSTAGNRNYVGD